MSSLLEQIRIATQGQHEQLERRLNLFERVKTSAGYIDLLQRYEMIYREFENALKSNSTLGDREDRWKYSSILSDLGDLQPAFSPPLTTNRITIDSEADTWGVWYVLEGSTLGGQVICKHLKSLFPHLHAENGLRFFSGYGGATRTKWQSFIQQLEAMGERMSNVQRTQVAESARRIFAAFEEALCGANRL